MNKIIEEQLKKVENADLSNYCSETNTYIIPKRVDIRVDVDSCYLIQLLPTCFTNETIKVNWNNNSMPMYNYLKVDVANKMSDMIKVIGVGYNFDTQSDISYFWNGWLSLKDIKVIEKL